MIGGGSTKRADLLPPRWGPGCSPRLRRTSPLYSFTVDIGSWDAPIPPSPPWPDLSVSPLAQGSVRPATLTHSCVDYQRRCYRGLNHTCLVTTHPFQRETIVSGVEGCGTGSPAGTDRTAL